GVLAVVGKALVYLQRRLAGEQGDAVVALLAMVVHVVAELADLRFRELVVGDLGFLQADHVRPMLLDQRLQLMGAGTQAIDIEGNDLHGRATDRENADASPVRRARPASGGGAMAVLSWLATRFA